MPRTFKTIDRFVDGTATSIKSIDLNAATYQDGARLTYRLNDYIDKLATYSGGRMGTLTISPESITARILSFAVPRNSMTEIQRAAFETARLRAKAFGIDLKVTEF